MADSQDIRNDSQGFQFRCGVESYPALEYGAMTFWAGCSENIRTAIQLSLRSLLHRMRCCAIAILVVVPCSSFVSSWWSETHKNAGRLE